MRLRSVLIAALVSALAAGAFIYVLYRNSGDEQVGFNVENSTEGGRDGGSGSFGSGSGSGRGTGTGTGTPRPGGSTGGPGGSLSAEELARREKDKTKKPDAQRRPTLSDRPAELLVYVEDDNSEPVSKVSVVIRNDTGSREGITNRDGEAVFEEIPATRYWIRVVDLDGAELTSASPVTLLPDTVRDVRIRLTTHDSGLSGTIRDTQGRPLEGIEIRATAMEKGSGELILIHGDASLVVQSGPDGAFEVLNLSDGEYVIETVGTETHSSARKSVMAPGNDVDLVVHELRVVRITGQVEDSAGQPIAEAEISLPGYNLMTKSTPRGDYVLEFEMKEWSHGTVLVKADKPGFGSARESIPVRDILARITAGEAVEQSFVLTEALDVATLTGFVVDDEGEPVIQERVHLQSYSMNAHHRGLTRADGSYEITQLQAGEDYRLWVHPRRHYRDYAIESFAVRAGENELDIALESLDVGTLDGVIRDADGKPLGSFTVMVRSLEAVANTNIVTTDPQGRFLVEDLPVGPLLIETRTLPKVTVRGFEIVADETKTVDVHVGIGKHTVEGEVKSKDGEIQGARVILTWTRQKDKIRSHLFQETVTDEDGAFAFTGIGTGSCSLGISAPGHKSKRVGFKIDETGPDDELDIELEPDSSDE